MPLKVNLRHLEEHELHLKGELPVAELEFELKDEMVQARQPLQYDLEVEPVAHGVLVQGKLALTLDCECVRCLKPVQKRLKLPHWTLHLPLEGEEKATVVNDCIDLTPFIREDMLLEFPQHPACEPECAGFKKTGPAQKGKPEAKPVAWNELDKLKL